MPHGHLGHPEPQPGLLHRGCPPAGGAGAPGPAPRGTAPMPNQGQCAEPGSVGGGTRPPGRSAVSPTAGMQPHPVATTRSGGCGPGGAPVPPHPPAVMPPCWAPLALGTQQAGRARGSHWVSVSQRGRKQGPPGSTPAAAPTSRSCSQRGSTPRDPQRGPMLGVVPGGRQLGGVGRGLGGLVRAGASEAVPGPAG